MEKVNLKGMGYLRFVVNELGRFPHLMHKDGNWTVRNDVMLNNAFIGKGASQPLSPGTMGRTFGYVGPNCRGRRGCQRCLMAEHPPAHFRVLVLLGALELSGKRSPGLGWKAVMRHLRSADKVVMSFCQAELVGVTDFFRGDGRAGLAVGDEGGVPIGIFDGDG